MAYYECVIIARQDISAGQVDQLVEDYTKILEENGGAVASKENWGLRSLAYRIRKNRKGHYVLLNIDAPHAAITELERQMRLSEDVIRFLTIATKELQTGPSPVMQNRNRDDRGRRGGGRDGGRDGGGRDGGGRDRGPSERSDAPPAGEEKKAEAPAASAETAKPEGASA